MASLLHVTFPEPDLAVLSFDTPGKSVNVLSREMLSALEQEVTALKQREHVRGLILISQKPAAFIAGADVKEFAAHLSTSKDELIARFSSTHALFRQCSELPFPTVAAIHGLSLGGGTELALWCDGRVLSRDAKTVLGFPEVKLGLIPGWGGTVRTPRMIGLANALDLITSGEPVTAERAKLLGLADDLVAASQLLPAAIRLVRQLAAADRYRVRRASWSQPVVMPPAEHEFLTATTLAKIHQTTGGNYPAPIAAAKLMLATASLPIDEALQRESRVMAELFGSTVNRALLNVFLLTDRAKKPIAVEQNASTNKIARAGLIGAGIMGMGIATAQVKSELSTTLVDQSPQALEHAARSVLEEVAYDKQLQAANPQRAIRFGAYLHTTEQRASLADCDLVLEAIVENQQAKTELYASLETLLKPDCILVSNTSTIPISVLAEKLQYPHRFCGIHFFNPVRRMKVVEVIRGQATSADTIARACAYVRQLGKFPLVVQDSPGFLVNRMLSPYLNAALEMLGQGITITQIDQAAVKFGMPLGPLELYDLVGLDTAINAGRTMWKAFPERFTPSPLLPALLKAERLGQKNGLGFYNYNNRQHLAQEDVAVTAILQRYTRGQLELTTEQIQWRLLLPMLLEATRVLEEGIVNDARDIDTGVIYGLGFPTFHGGLCYWADTQGANRILQEIEQLSSTRKPLEVPQLLRDLAANRKTFYARGEN